jgi:DNA-directed RNA polymerase specialized sigma24 family protein
MRHVLLARCLRLLGNPAEAEDAVQETFASADRLRLGRGDARSGLRTRLFRR